MMTPDEPINEIVIGANFKMGGFRVGICEMALIGIQDPRHGPRNYILDNEALRNLIQWAEAFLQAHPDEPLPGLKPADFMRH